jgi:hypothetical protein
MPCKFGITILAFLGSAFLCAQTLNTGTFFGTVKDPSGAAVPEASVRIAREGTQLRREVATDAEGNYRLLEIPAGEYRVEFERAGFRKTLRSGIMLSAGQSLRLDAELAIGSVTETVLVEERVAQVDANTANVGNTVYASQVQELALPTRSFSTLVILQPGVNSNETQQPMPSSGLSFSINGAQSSANNWLLDGGRNLDTYNGNNQTMVNLDAIAEVFIERNAYRAESGRNGGAQINVITRSGSNAFHGTVFEFFRNDRLDARSFFAAGKPKRRYNNFGGTVGGPIKRDKLFFFLSNEYRRMIQSSGTRTSIVPTDAMIGGDFSGLRTIKDPDTGQPFSGNRIPADRLDANAQLLLKNYYERPTPGFRQGALNYTDSSPNVTNYRSALGRLDYNVSPTLSVYGRYNIDSSRPYDAFGWTGANSMSRVSASQEAHIMYTANGSANWTIRPNLLNQTTMAWYHGAMADTNFPYAYRARVPAFNVPRVFSKATDSAIFIPSISMSQGYAAISLLWPQNISHYTYELADNVSYITGRHTIRFGGAIDKENKTQNNSSPNNNGTFSFDGSSTGDAMADLLLGRAYSYTENSDHVMGSLNFTNFSLYVQDQFRVHPRLSLTYGLRWEYFPPERDYGGTISFFDPRSFDRSKAAQVLSNGQIVIGTENFGNGIVVAGKDAKFGYALTNTVHDSFAPRLGFSYALTRDNLTVMRGGYGMFHDRWAQYASGARNNYPFNQSLSIFNTSFSNPAQGARRIFPISLRTFNSPWEIPYLQKWSLGIQRQLPAEFVLDVSYVGSKGTHLVKTRDANQPLPDLVIASGQTSPNALRPYLGFAAITSYETTANSTYNSLQVSVVRRLANGFSLQGAYTFSKTMDNTITPASSYSSSRLDRGMTGSDRTHVVISSYVWELPFARNTKGWRRKVLHGWQLSGISSFQSGNPLTIGVSGDRAGVGGGGQRPNVVGQVERLKDLSKWFTTEAFALPALGTFGNAGRSLVRGPGINNWDIVFSKRTDLKEKITLQFRSEFFNLFNHAQFSSVATTVNSSTFGQVTGTRDPRIIQFGLRLLF